MNEAKFDSPVSAAFDAEGGPRDIQDDDRIAMETKPSERANKVNWLDMLSDYVRENPKIAAAIAFEVGVAAGLLTRTAGHAIGRTGAGARVRRGMAPSFTRLRDAVAPALSEIAMLFSGGNEVPSRRKTRRRPSPGRSKRRKTSSRRRAA